MLFTHKLIIGAIGVYFIYSSRDVILDSILTIKLKLSNLYNNLFNSKGYSINKVYLFSNLFTYYDVTNYFTFNRIDEINQTVILDLFNKYNIEFVDNKDIRLKFDFNFDNNNYVLYFPFHKLIFDNKSIRNHLDSFDLISDKYFDTSSVVYDPIELDFPVLKDIIINDHVPEVSASQDPFPEEPVLKKQEPVPEEQVLKKQDPVPEEPVPKEPVIEEQDPVPEEPILELVTEDPVPEELVPEEQVSQEPVPEDPVPEELVPEELVPEEQEPFLEKQEPVLEKQEPFTEETVPEKQEPVPEEPVPEEPVPKEPVPKECVSEKEVIETVKESKLVEHFSSYPDTIDNDYFIEYPPYTEKVLEDYRKDIIYPYYTKLTSKSILYSLFMVDCKNILKVLINGRINNNLLNYIDKLKTPLNDFGLCFHCPIKLSWILVENNIKLDTFDSLRIEFMNPYFDEDKIELVEHYIELNKEDLDSILISRKMENELIKKNKLNIIN
jgi:hypothetical protein